MTTIRRRQAMGAATLLMVVAMACTEPPPPPPAPEPRSERVEEARPTGPSPRDPVIARALTFPLEPIVVDASGAEVPVVALRSGGGRILGWRGAGDGFDPGEHTLTGVTYPNYPMEPVSWSVLPYGRGPAFDPDAIVGVTYLARLDFDHEGWLSPIHEVAFLSLGKTQLWLEIEEISPEGEVLFRFIGSVQDSPPCMALRARGTVTPSGIFTFQADALDVDAGGGQPLAIRQGSVELAFLEDGSAAGGGSFVAHIDADELSELMLGDPTERETGCSLLGLCFECDVPSGRCLEARVDALEFSIAEETFPEDLPRCGVDLDGVIPDIEPISCDLDLDLNFDFDFDFGDVVCGCTTGTNGAPPLALLALWALARRRRRL